MIILKKLDQQQKQKEGESFISIYSPTSQSDSLRITIAIASINKWNLKQLDIKAAYLNADLNETIYVKIPKGDKNYNKNKVWLLKKALYGLKQAGRMWNEEITNYLKSIGFKQYKSDKCLFGKCNEENRLIELLTLYVDDILITGEDYEIKNIMMVVNIDDIPKNTNIIDTRWVLVIKNDNTKKARLVAKAKGR